MHRIRFEANVSRYLQTVQRNAVNPIWQHTCTFRVNFLDFAMLRVAILDSAANGKCVAQRVVPLRCLRPGYRHMRLRTPANLPLDQSMLFIRTRFEEEEHIYLHDEDSHLLANSCEQTLAFEPPRLHDMVRFLIVSK